MTVTQEASTVVPTISPDVTTLLRNGITTRSKVAISEALAHTEPLETVPVSPSELMARLDDLDTREMDTNDRYVDAVRSLGQMRQDATSTDEDANATRKKLVEDIRTASTGVRITESDNSSYDPDPKE